MQAPDSLILQLCLSNSQRFGEGVQEGKQKGVQEDTQEGVQEHRREGVQEGGREYRRGVQEGGTEYRSTGVHNSGQQAPTML